MSNQEAIYVGSGKKHDNYDFINISIAESKVRDYWSEWDGERYLRLTVSKRREKDKYGKTHSVRIDTWKPTPQESAPKANNVQGNSDLPF